MPRIVQEWASLEDFAPLLHEWNERLWYKLPDGRKLVVEIEGQQYWLEKEKGLYYSTRSPALLLQHSGKRCSVRLMDCPDPARAGPPARLEEFLWFVGMSAGDGRLFQWIDPRLRFVIKRWPPVENSSSHFGLSAHLSRSAHSISSLLARSELPIGLVHNYLNACSLAGILKATTDERPVPVPTAEQAPPIGKAVLAWLRKGFGLPA